MPLTFGQLRQANETRLAEWPGGEHVDLAFRGLELWGESGELGNKLKKLVRLQRGIKGTTEGHNSLMQDIRDEMGDVLISLDLIAMELAGLGRTRLFAGSWSEWSSDPSRPVEKG